MMLGSPSRVIDSTLAPVAAAHKQSVGRVTDASIIGWKRFALRHGITPTSFAEALGIELDSLDAKLDDLPEVFRRAVLNARAIAAESRSRPSRRRA